LPQAAATPACTKTPLCSTVGVFLCLSQACLGKPLSFIWKWRRKSTFRTLRTSLSWAGGSRRLRAPSLPRETRPLAPSRYHAPCTYQRAHKKRLIKLSIKRSSKSKQQQQQQQQQPQEAGGQKQQADRGLCLFAPHHGCVCCKCGVSLPLHPLAHCPRHVLCLSVPAPSNKQMCEHRE
jgi:hypothetical protein